MELNAAATGHFDSLGSFPHNCLLLLGREHSLQMPQPSGPANFVQRAATATNLRQEHFEVNRVEGRQLQLRHPYCQAANAVHVTGRILVVPRKNVVKTLGRRAGENS